MHNKFMFSWCDMILVWFRTLFHESLGDISWLRRNSMTLLVRAHGGASWLV